MAKAPAATSTPAPAAGGFSFSVRKGVAIPPPSPTRLQHQFPWDTLEAGDSFEVPKSYWTDQRKIAADKATATYARERIRSHFRQWQEKKPERSQFGITMRSGKDDTVEVWLVKSG